MLHTYLQKIDEQLATPTPEVAAQFRPGANDKQLALLGRTFFDGGEIPEDLATFFRWHDGQTGYHSLSPLDNRMLMSIDDVIDTWEFLASPDEEIQQPWCQNWIPIFANGAGDYVVYVASGDIKGHLIGYWHDASDRRVKFESLDAWAQKVISSFEE